MKKKKKKKVGVNPHASSSHSCVFAFELSFMNRWQSPNSKTPRPPILKMQSIIQNHIFIKYVVVLSLSYIFTTSSILTSTNTLVVHQNSYTHVSAFFKEDVRVSAASVHLLFELRYPSEDVTGGGKWAEDRNSDEKVSSRFTAFTR